VLADDIAGWLAEEALGSSQPSALFEALCLRLRATGIPVLRGHVTFNVLHPLYSAGALVWTAEGVDIRLLGRDGQGSEEYLKSPIRHVIEHGLPLLRRRLTGRTALLDFPILTELRDRGGSDYLMIRVPFEGRANDGPGNRRGIIGSWVCDRPSGYTDGEIRLLQRITNRLAVALKGRLERSIADNVASAYLGRAAGEAVLNGGIHRGDGEKIQAALWYSDLRHSSTLADHDTAEGFLSVLNRYFEMTAGAIRDNGGEVVSFIGDAVLGFFRVDFEASEACARALEAADEAGRRLVAYVPEAGGARIEFGIGLHLGHVIYGNVGVPDRLQFTLVGAAVNEVARLEDLTKSLGYSLVASAAFAHEVARDWRSLGEHVLRGIANTTEVFTTARPEE
jgi:adenylate cyclase